MILINFASYATARIGWMVIGAAGGMSALQLIGVTIIIIAAECIETATEQ